MPGYRRDRINEETTNCLSEIIREVKDPRVSSALISIIASDVSADFKFAKIYYSAIGKTEKSELQKGLESASGFIRKQLAERLNLRITPELRFVYDESIEHGAHIEKLLKQVERDHTDE